MSCDTISESYSKKKISFAGGPRKAGLNGKGLVSSPGDSVGPRCSRALASFFLMDCR